MTSHVERLHFDKREKKSTRQALNHQTHQWRARDSSTEGKKRGEPESSHLRLSISQVVVCETRRSKKGTFKLIDFLLKAC